MDYSMLRVCVQPKRVMVNLTSHVPGEYLHFQTTKRLISEISSGLGFGEKTIEKSGSGKVSKTQVFDFLPESVKILGVGYSYPTEWLLPVILSYLAPPNSLSVAFCARYKKSRVAPPPSANYLNIYLHMQT